MSKRPASGRGYRVRERNTEQLASITVHYYDSTGHETYSHPYVGISADAYEHTVGIFKDYNGSKMLWNPCDHVKVTGQLGEIPVHNYPGTEQPHVSFEGDANNGTRCLVRLEDLLSLIPDPPMSSVQSKAKQMLTSISELMPSQVGIANFLIELREGVRGIVPSLKRSKDMLGSLYLGIKFGVQAFVSDLKKLTKTWSYFRNRLKWLQKSNGHDTWTRRGSQKEDPTGGFLLKDPIDVLLPTGNPDIPAGYHLGYRLSPVSGSLKAWWRLNMRTFFHIKGLEKFWTQVDLFSAALGLNNPAKIAWNAKSMSWLVDYFVNLDPYLDKLAGSAVDIYQDGNIHLKHAYFSYKVEFDVDVFFVRYWSCNTKPAPSYPIHVGRLRVSKYVREAGFPLTEEDLLSCNLTTDQKAILLALAESRTKWDKLRWGRWAARDFHFSGFAKMKLGFREPSKRFRRIFRGRK